MKKVILYCSLFCLWGIPTKGAEEAADSCFIAKENDKVLQQEGDCDTQHTPQSTFKVVLSLIGFDAGLLKDENNPSWSCLKEYDHYINVCKGVHTPRTWMRDSCLWYSRVLTQKLGMNKFQSYVQNFNYGNKDLTGNKGQNDGLTHAWISSSLKISALEQIEFLQKFVNEQLPISSHAFSMTKNVMYIQELSGGWKLYGKTGNGQQFDEKGVKTDKQHGWFVGFIEKGNRKIIFASHLIDRKKQSTFASMRVRNDVLIKLWTLINELER